MEGDHIKRNQMEERPWETLEFLNGAFQLKKKKKKERKERERDFCQIDLHMNYRYYENYHI